MMSGPSKLMDAIREAEIGLKEARERLSRAHKEVSAAYDRRSLAVEDLLKSHTDEEILASIDLFRILTEEAFDRQYANERLRSICTIGSVDAFEFENRERFEYFPCPRIQVNYEQDVSGLARDLREWISKFMFGRPDMYMGVLDHALCADGSYGVLVSVDGSAKLQHTRYGHTEDIFLGTLEEVLNEVARVAWYDGGPTSYGFDY